jgi:hypothetical protein
LLAAWRPDLARSQRCSGWNDAVQLAITRCGVLDLVAHALDEWRGALRTALETECVDTTHLHTVSGPTFVVHVRLEHRQWTFICADPGVHYPPRVDEPIAA